MFESEDVEWLSDCLICGIVGNEIFIERMRTKVRKENNPADNRVSER